MEAERLKNLPYMQGKHVEQQELLKYVCLDICFYQIPWKLFFKAIKKTLVQFIQMDMLP